MADTSLCGFRYCVPWGAPNISTTCCTHWTTAQFNTTHVQSMIRATGAGQAFTAAMYLLLVIMLVLPLWKYGARLVQGRAALAALAAQAQGANVDNAMLGHPQAQ